MTFASRLSAALSPSGYLATLGFMVHEWQQRVLSPHLKRVCMLCARQSGKSTVVAGYALWKAKFFPNSLILIVAPAKDQAQETMGKIKQLASLDKELEDRATDSKHELVLKTTRGSWRCLVRRGRPAVTQLLTWSFWTRHHEFPMKPILPSAPR